MCRICIYFIINFTFSAKFVEDIQKAPQLMRQKLLKHVEPFKSELNNKEDLPFVTIYDVMLY